MDMRFKDSGHEGQSHLIVPRKRKIRYLPFSERKMQKLNKTLLKNEWIIEEMKGEIKNI